jgi:propanol-preferring alcohol dehydrogenase
MTAYRLVEWQAPAVFEAVPVPAPGPDDVLIEVAGVGLCHTDIHFLHAPPGAFAYDLPFTLGHEIGGRVAALGSAVDGLGGGGLAVGDAVVVAPGPRCWRCPPCLRGDDNLCTARTTGRGWGQDGGLTRYVVVPAREAVPLPTLDPVAAAPLADAGLTAYHAVRRALPRLRGRATALVIGVGGLGGFAVQFLRQLAGCRIVAVDVSPTKLARARELGADLALAADDVDAAAVRDLTAGLGADAVLDFVGVDATMALALRSARVGGTIAIVGAAGGTATVGWGHLPHDCELAIPNGGTTADLHDVVALAEAGRLRIDVERFPFEQTPDAYGRVEAGTIDGRAVVVLDRATRA